MKILHSADFHYSRDNQEPALLSLRTFYEYGRDNGVDLFAIAGDLFDRAVQNTESSGFPQLVKVIQEMMNIAPVVAVQGTPTHDIAGCYEALQEIQAQHSFTLLSPHQHYLLSQVDVWPAEDLEDDEPRLLILGCPEPSKEWFLKDKSLGRDEATQAVKEGMRQMLLGWGAIRKQYADIPCLFVYHGSVEGASMCNGQTLPMGELAIGRDDLALVGADYYALGHIHKAQQIGDLPAYYAGSVFPVNWGELDQKGFNCAESKEFYAEAEDNEFADHSGDKWIWKSEVQRIPYPHSPRKKITMMYWGHWTEKQSLFSQVAGAQVWFEALATKQQAAAIKREELLSELLTNGALEGSRVTVTILPTETVRAGHITEAKSLEGKIQIYGVNSEDLPPSGMLEKAAMLEAEARAEGLSGEGLHIRIDRLILRGAIGIQKGQGKEEIAVDFCNFDPGLVALVGLNGAGKTTLIENAHPFTTMLTRSGKLQDHFCLRDSWRDLYFTDEKTGCQYRAFIQIDGQNTTGKCEYHLYRDGQPLTDGRKESYEQKIAELFGSLNLFQRSAFVTQKNTKGNPDLSEATKGERKALFRELGGLDYLQHYSENAREKAKAIEQTILTDQGRIENLEEFVAGTSAKEDELADLVMERDEKQDELTTLEASGKQLKAELELLREKVEANKRVAERIGTSEKRQGELTGEMAILVQKRGEYAQATQMKGDAETAIQQAEVLQAEGGKLNGEKSKMQAEREQKLTEHRDRSQVVASEEKRLSAEKATVEAQTAENRTKKAGFVAKIDQINAFLEKTVACPKCDYHFVPGGEEQRQELEILQDLVWGTDKDIAACEKIVAVFQKQIDALVYPPDPELPGFGDLDAKITDIQEQLAVVDVTRLRGILQKAQEAEVRLEEMEKRRQQIKGEQDQVAVDIEDLKKQLDPPVVQRFDTKQHELTEAENLYRQKRDILKGLEASIAALEKQIYEMGKKAGELLQLKVAVEGKQIDAAEWRYLERACGPDGIQALELDAMGPGIAEIANRLLQAAYGSRFQVEFRTTRMGGQGSKRKQIEDFQIIVHDSEDGSEAPYEWMSGGEGVWIKRAIYDAFGIVRDQNTGQRFLTVFQDEADGALDTEARLAYFRMLEAAHQESGRHHTIIITHSQEAQEMVAQRIVMSELQAPVREAVV